MDCSRLARWFTCITPGVAVLAALIVAAGAAAQQFQDQTAARFPASPNEYCNSVTVGDIDGDTDLDLVFANGQNYSTVGAPLMLRIYINNGTGTFTDESVARTGGLTFRARGVELGDVERDGDLDIIVANDFVAAPALLINNGVGLFTDQSLARLPTTTLTSMRAQFVDVENDGDLDIYLCNSGGTTRFNGTGGVQKLYLNNGSGVFSNSPVGMIPGGNVIQPMDCIFGDIDGDFDLDVRIAGRGTNTSRLWRNNGLGTYSNLAFAVADATCYNYDFGDMDGDGDLDLLGVNAGANSTELLLANNGNGTAYSNVSAQLTTNPMVDDNDSKWFDYDNDGDLDLIIARLPAGPDRIYNNNGTGTYTDAAGLIPATADSTLDVKIADLTGDGRLDIVTAQGENAPFTNKIYVNVTGPVDTIAPNILRTEQALTPAPGVGGPFTIRTEIFDSHTSDRGFHDKGVFLKYQMNAGPVNQVPMQWSGNSLWRGVIPAQTSGGTLHYWVTAADFANNLRTGPVRDVPIDIQCAGDADGNFTVDIDDLVLVITGWGETVQIINIGVQDTNFTPSSFNARAGDTLRFNWVSGTHTATSGTACAADGKFDFPITSGTPTNSYVIPHAFSGNLPFFCTPHCGKGMTGSAAVASFGADLNGSGTVNIDDLVEVITHWGVCK